MDPAKPSLDLVRSATDEHVLRALLRYRRLTRAELATATGISKPTAGESVRRLTERGLIADTGERTPGGRGKGRVGTYYALAGDVGTALVVAIAPEGVVAETIDVYGDTAARATRPGHPERIAAALSGAVAEAAAGHSPRLAVVSAADPVDRATGRLVHLPDAAFLVGELDPAAIIGPHVAGPVTVGNDVNWAARAERAAAPGTPDDFAYLYLGEGLGCAVVSDGAVHRGGAGLAGEIAHLVTAGSDGRAMRFVQVFAELGLHRPGTSAIDTAHLLAAAAADPAVRSTLGTAVAGAVAAVIALADPACVIVGGPWGVPLLGDIRTAVAALPRHVPVRPTALTSDAPLTGARAEAVRLLQDSVIGRPA